MVRFFCYSQFHGKSEPVGSDAIRVYQTLKYWPEAGIYRYGENPDTLIFTKIFSSPDYKFPKHFKGIKILDICDPTWLEGYNIAETCQAVDVVTCPTKSLADFLKQFHDNVVIVPDRFDVEILPKPKEHKQKAKTVVWFGYSHNAELLKPAMGLIEELKLNLIVISNDDPIVNRWSPRKKEDWYTFIKHKADIYADLQKADFALLPEGFRPEDRFKSNNKTIKANLAGLPVARTSDEVKHYMDAKNRQSWVDQDYGNIKEQYDIRKSVEQYKDIINGIKSSRQTT